jgi:hypothetical protein
MMSTMSQENACGQYPPAMPAVEYVSLRVSRATRDALQQLQLRWSADVGRRLTLTEVVDTAAALAQQHSAEAVEALTSD